MKAIVQHARAATAFLVGAAIALTGPAASAQCVLCYLSASSTGERGASVLRAGILVLLIPTVLIFGGLTVLVLRRREPVALAPDAAADGLLSRETLPPDGATLLPLSAGRENQSPSSL